MDALAWSGTMLADMLANMLAYIGPGEGFSHSRGYSMAMALLLILPWVVGFLVVFAILEVRWRGQGRKTGALAASSVTATLAFICALLTLLVPFGIIDTSYWSGNEWLRPWGLWFALLGFVAWVSGAASWSLARNDGAPSVLRSLHATQILAASVVFPALGAATAGAIYLTVLYPMLEARLLLLGALASVWLMGLAFVPIETTDRNSKEMRHAMRLGVVTHAGVAILLTWIAVTFTTGVPWGSIAAAAAAWIATILGMGLAHRVGATFPDQHARARLTGDVDPIRAD